MRLKVEFSQRMSEGILMKKSKYSDAQILSILKQAKNGVPVADLCRQHGMSAASFYKWRAKYGGMDASLISRVKALDEENRRLKKMYAEKHISFDDSRYQEFLARFIKVGSRFFSISTRKSRSSSRNRSA